MPKRRTQAVQEMTIPVANGALPGLLLRPADCQSALVLAHGAGAGMRHRWMQAVSCGLADRGIATLRFDFPYMVRGSRIPDRPPAACAAIRAAVEAARLRLGELPLFAGGKSFGGRMTSHAQAEAPLPGVHGLVFLGFPLHPASKPSLSRAAHLPAIALPMLFIGGSRDALADPELMRSTTAGLGERATLIVLEGADHSFHVAAGSGQTDAGLLEQACDSVRGWMLAVCNQTPAINPRLRSGGEPPQ